MKNNFPIRVVKKILNEEKEKIDIRNNADKNKQTIQTDVKFESKDKSYLLLLPYQEDNCSENYIRESGHRISERIINHNGRDQRSHIFKHSSEKCRQHFHTISFKIIGNGFKNNSFKRKVSEALLIKQVKLSLNVQEKSIELKLFN